MSQIADLGIELIILDKLKKLANTKMFELNGEIFVDEKDCLCEFRNRKETIENNGRWISVFNILADNRKSQAAMTLHFKIINEIISLVASLANENMS